MISCHQINEYVYCPRRYYYIKYLGLNPSNDHIEEGKQFHKKTTTKEFNNLFFSDEALGIKGKIDYLTQKDKLTLFELKKGKSKILWDNDRLQLLSYYLLAKKNKMSVEESFVKYSNGKKFKVELDNESEKEVKQVVNQMQNLTKLPSRCSNLNKCNGCNLKEYCWV